jgi:hypothetical protein
MKGLTPGTEVLMYDFGSDEYKTPARIRECLDEKSYTITLYETEEKIVISISEVGVITPQELRRLKLKGILNS